MYIGRRLLGEDEIEKMIQKKELKKQLADEIELKKDEFRHYLKRDYALYPLPDNHRKLSAGMKYQFEGRANSALRQLLYENIEKAEDLNKRFEQFLDNF